MVQNYHFTQKFVSLFMLIAALSMTFMGCSPAAPESSSSTVVVPTATIAAPTAAPTRQPSPLSPATEPAATQAASGDCLVGKWLLTDYTSYFSSIQAKASASGDVTITNDGLSGQAWFEFGPDGKASITADQFSQSFTLNTTAAGATVTVPASVLINGRATSDYSVSGDQITFSNQSDGDLKTTITVMGSSTDEANQFMGQPGSTTLYQYTCVDADTLSLKVIAVDQDFNPLTLKRTR